jgi:hypothetical protein
MAKKRLFEMVHDLELARLKYEALNVKPTCNDIMKTLVLADILEVSDVVEELTSQLINYVADNVTSAKILSPSFIKISEILILLNSAKKYLEVIE